MRLLLWPDIPTDVGITLGYPQCHIWCRSFQHYVDRNKSSSTCCIVGQNCSNSLYFVHFPLPWSTNVGNRLLWWADLPLASWSWHTQGMVVCNLIAINSVSWTICSFPPNWIIPNVVVNFTKFVLHLEEQTTSVRIHLHPCFSCPCSLQH